MRSTLVFPNKKHFTFRVYASTRDLDMETLVILQADHSSAVIQKY